MEFRWKNRAKPSESSHFATLKRKKKNAVLIEKRKMLVDFFNIKISVPINFMCL